MHRPFRILAAAAVLATTAVASLSSHAHGNVVPQAVDTTGLTALGESGSIRIPIAATR